MGALIGWDIEPVQGSDNILFCPFLKTFLVCIL
jgi:hypothetical protein